MHTSLSLDLPRRSIPGEAVVTDLKNLFLFFLFACSPPEFLGVDRGFLVLFSGFFAIFFDLPDSLAFMESFSGVA